MNPLSTKRCIFLVMLVLGCVSTPPPTTESPTTPATTPTLTPGVNSEKAYNAPYILLIYCSRQSHYVSLPRQYDPEGSDQYHACICVYFMISPFGLSTASPFNARAFSQVVLISRGSYNKEDKLTLIISTLFFDYQGFCNQIMKSLLSLSKSNHEKPFCISLLAEYDVPQYGGDLFLNSRIYPLYIPGRTFTTISSF